jgi:hypothetical protein
MINHNGEPEMAKEKKNFSGRDVLEVVNALIYIAICRFMVIRPDCWDAVSRRLSRLKEKINDRRNEIIKKPGAPDEKTGACAIAPAIRDDDAVENPFWIREI